MTTSELKYSHTPDMGEISGFASDGPDGASYHSWNAYCEELRKREESR